MGNHGGAAGPCGLAWVYRVRRRPGLLTAAAFPVCSHLSGSDFQQEVKRRPAVGLLQVAAASRCFLERRRCCQAPGGVPVRWTLPPRRVFATKTVSNKNRRGVSTFSARSGALARSRLRFPACLLFHGRWRQAGIPQVSVSGPRIPIDLLLMTSGLGFARLPTAPGC